MHTSWFSLTTEGTLGGWAWGGRAACVFLCVCAYDCMFLYVYQRVLACICLSMCVCV